MTNLNDSVILNVNKWKELVLFFFTDANWYNNNNNNNTNPVKGLFGSFSWSDVRFWDRDVYVNRFKALWGKFVICENGLYK